MVQRNENYSPRDVYRGIVIPTDVTPKLAELIGVVIGDGHVTYTTKNRKLYEVCISGSKEDYENHHKTFVIPAFKELFNAEPYVRFRRRDECETAFRSKMIATFFHKKLGIPSNKKNVSVPSMVTDGKIDIKMSFLRGLFDTDGCFCIKKSRNRCQPVVSFFTISTPLFNTVKGMLNEVGVRFSAFDSRTMHFGYEKVSYGHKIEICGNNSVMLWIQTVGFHNGKYNEKIYEWTRRELNS